MTKPEHPFAATLAQMRPPEKQGGGFANLTNQQQWEWHADVYAYRRVVLGVRPESGERELTPPDPKGEWFSKSLIGQAEAYYRDVYKKPLERQQKIRGDELQREGRDWLNQWAQKKGHADIDEYAAATYPKLSQVIGQNGMSPALIEAYMAYLHSPEFREDIAKDRARRMGVTIPEKVSPDYRAVAEMLGLTARETREPKYTPEQMAGARRALGIPEPLPPIDEAEAAG